MRLRGVRMLGCSVAELLGLGVRDSRALNRSLESLTTPFVESPSPPTVSCGGRRCRRRMRGALYEICAIYRRWSERARRCANDVLVKRPLIRLRHPSTRFARSGQALLPQQETAGGEGLSIGGTAENEPLVQLHIVASFATNSLTAIPLNVTFRPMGFRLGGLFNRYTSGMRGQPGDLGSGPPALMP